jgi:hypothetical protein
MAEALTPWLPLEGMDEELFLEALRCNLGELQVVLSKGKGAARALAIDFGMPLAFRAQPQHVYLSQPWWGTLSAASIYTVEHSEYKSWLKGASSELVDHMANHYRIITVDGCLDVLTSTTPIAAWRDIASVGALPPNKSFERTPEG